MNSCTCGALEQMVRMGKQQECSCFFVSFIRSRQSVSDVLEVKVLAAQQRTTKPAEARARPHHAGVTAAAGAANAEHAGVNARIDAAASAARQNHAGADSSGHCVFKQHGARLGGLLLARPVLTLFPAGMTQQTGLTKAQAPDQLRLSGSGSTYRSPQTSSNPISPQIPCKFSNSLHHRPQHTPRVSPSTLNASPS